MTAKTGLSLSYNAANRLSQAVIPAQAGIQFVYNSSGQRVKKTVGGETTVFHHDRSGHLIAETGSGGLLIQREYIWLDDLPLSVAATVYRPEVITDNTDSAFSTSGSWSSSTAASGYYGSDYQAHTPAGAPSGTQVLDDLDSGTSNTGTWVPLSGTPPGYEGIGYQRSGFSLSPNVFTWNLSLLSPGDYRVYVRWVSDPSYSTDARYTVTHATGSAIHSVNQTSGGGNWYLLGTYAFSTSAQISLTDPAGGTLIADAVRVIPVTAITDTAHWNPPEAQSYEVYARWPAAAHHSSRAVYAVTHSAGTNGLIQDQTQNGSQWNLLGTFTFTNTTTQGISLGTDPDSTVAADAVKFIPTGSSVTQTTKAYVHADHLNTPQKMTDQSQAVVWEAAYEPFGETTITKQPYYENPMRFPGQYEDAETGLHDNWMRTYSSGEGRYSQSDPIGLWGGISTYGYGYQNPVRYVDPDGLDALNYDYPFEEFVPQPFPTEASPIPEKGPFRLVCKCIAQNMAKDIAQDFALSKGGEQTAKIPSKYTLRIALGAAAFLKKFGLYMEAAALGYNIGDCSARCDAETNSCGD